MLHVHSPLSFCILEGAQISQCESAETYVDGGSFKYFRSSFNAATSRVTIEIVDRKGGLLYYYVNLSQSYSFKLLYSIDNCTDSLLSP